MSKLAVPGHPSKAESTPRKHQSTCVITTVSAAIPRSPSSALIRLVSTNWRQHPRGNSASSRSIRCYAMVLHPLKLMTREEQLRWHECTSRGRSL